MYKRYHRFVQSLHMLELSTVEMVRRKSPAAKDGATKEQSFCRPSAFALLGRLAEIVANMIMQLLQILQCIYPDVQVLAGN